MIDDSGLRTALVTPGLLSLAMLMVNFLRVEVSMGRLSCQQSNLLLVSHRQLEIKIMPPEIRSTFSFI